MPAFFEYLRNITYYLIFAAVVGMLAPAGKYRKFVSLVMGFVLLSIMLAPLANLQNRQAATDWLQGLVPQQSVGVSPETAYTIWRDTYLRSAFEAQLTTQLESLLSQNNFHLHSVQFTFSEDFSAITNVHVTVSREEVQERVPFIRIQPVQIGQPDTNENCPTTTSAKNLISQFYNLSHQHIHVTVLGGHQ